MARSRRRIVGAAIVGVIVVSKVSTASAQQCYYPNGKPSPNDSPCSSDGGACCPVDWQCLDNGLCFLEQFGYYERHSCTDQAWGSSCPDMCTYNGTAIGNEAILNCGGDQFCCDWDRQRGNCCSKDATSFIMPTGNAFALVTSMGGAPSTMATVPAKTTTTHSDVSTSASPSSNTDSPSSTIAFSTTSSTTASSSSGEPPSTGTTSTIIITAGSGLSSAQTSTSATNAFSFDLSTSSAQQSTSGTTSISNTATPVASPTPTSAGAAGAGTLPLGRILGISLGIPFAVLAIGFVLWRLYQRRRPRYKQGQTNKFEPATSDMPGMYDHLPPGDPYKGGRMPEIDSYPVATKHLSELDGSTPQHFNAAAYNTVPADSPPPTNKTSNVSPLTNTNNRSSGVSSIQSSEQASPMQPQGLGLGFPRSSGAGGLYDVPEEAGLGPYAPYRAYRPPLVELAGNEVVPRAPASQPAPGERPREPDAGSDDDAGVAGERGRAAG